MKKLTRRRVVPTISSQAIRSIVTVSWSLLELLAAVRCTIGVAVPLLIGLAINEPLVGVFGAAGAVGFGSFQGAYPSRAVSMLLAAVGMAFSAPSVAISLSHRELPNEPQLAAILKPAQIRLLLLGYPSGFIGDRHHRRLMPMFSSGSGS